MQGDLERLGHFWLVSFHCTFLSAVSFRIYVALVIALAKFALVIKVSCRFSNRIWSENVCLLTLRTYDLRRFWILLPVSERRICNDWYVLDLFGDLFRGACSNQTVWLLNCINFLAVLSSLGLLLFINSHVPSNRTCKLLHML